MASTRPRLQAAGAGENESGRRAGHHGEIGAALGGLQDLLKSAELLVHLLFEFVSIPGHPVLAPDIGRLDIDRPRGEKLAVELVNHCRDLAERRQRLFSFSARLPTVKELGVAGMGIGQERHPGDCDDYPFCSRASTRPPWLCRRWYPNDRHESLLNSDRPERIGSVAQFENLEIVSRLGFSSAAICRQGPLQSPQFSVRLRAISASKSAR